MEIFTWLAQPYHEDVSNGGILLVMFLSFMWGALTSLILTGERS